MKHKCAALHCPKLIALRLLMCPVHWRMVAVAIRLRVLNNYVKDQEIYGDLITRAYRNAMDDAIEDVRQKEKEKEK